MKKRIIVSWIVTFGVVLLVVLGLFLFSVSPWAREKSDRMYRSEVGFEYGDEEDSYLLGVQKTKYDASFEYSVNCWEINGEILFQIYYVHDISGKTEEEKIERVMQIHKRGDSVFVLEQKINQVGIYDFDLSEEKNGFYVFCIEKTQPDTLARGTETLTKYDTNWSALLERIGVK